VITSGCPWPKATVKSPVGARDLRPVQRLMEKEGGSQNQSR
jgi:hypothetical protein